MNPCLGFILFFEGDHRKVNATIKNVTTFTSISAVLKQGDQNVTSTYITTTITTAGNMILTDDIGGKASMPAGNYRYFVTAVYGGKKVTWFWDILVLPKDGNELFDIPLGDYNPLIEDFTIYEGDQKLKALTVPGAVFSAATGLLKLNGSSDNLTATYCNSTVTPSGDTISTHLIGGAADIPPGDYCYFITATYNNTQAVVTFYYRIHVLAKQSII